MQITLPGMILLPLGIILFFILPKYLYYLTIFFIPFSATSLLNSAAGAPFMATQYFGTLFILSGCLNIVRKGKIRLPQSTSHDKSILLMFLFMAVVILTIMMPIIIDGRISTSTMMFKDIAVGYEKPLYFTFQNFKNTLPVIFGVLLAYLIVVTNSTPAMIAKTLKIYIFSALFVSIWGIIQYVCFVQQIEYPYFIFNTSIHDSVIESNTTTDIGNFNFLRIASVALEPSLLSQFLLTVVPIFLVLFAKSRIIYSPLKDRLVFSIILLVLLISTSTAAYLGLLIIVLFFLIGSFINNIIKVRYPIIVGVLSLIVIFLFYELNFTVRNYITEVIFNKSETSSVFERLYSITTAWTYFLEYPILGLGWATVTSHDLFVNLLANAGIIGFLSFFVMVLYIVSHSIRTAHSLDKKDVFKNEKLTIWLNSIIISFAAHLGISIFTEFTWYLPHFYFLLGMLIASNITANQYLRNEPKYEY